MDDPTTSATNDALRSLSSLNDDDSHPNDIQPDQTMENVAENTMDTTKDATAGRSALTAAIQHIAVDNVLRVRPRSAEQHLGSATPVSAGSVASLATTTDRSVHAARPTPQRPGSTSHPTSRPMSPRSAELAYPAELYGSSVPIVLKLDADLVHRSHTPSSSSRVGGLLQPGFHDLPAGGALPHPLNATTTVSVTPTTTAAPDTLSSLAAEVANAPESDSQRPSFYDEDFIDEDVLRDHEDQLRKEEEVAAQFAEHSDPTSSIHSAAIDDTEVTADRPLRRCDAYSSQPELRNYAAQIDNVNARTPLFANNYLQSPSAISSADAANNTAVSRFYPQHTSKDTHVVEERRRFQSLGNVWGGSRSPARLRNDQTSTSSIDSSKPGHINSLVGRYRHNLETKTCIIMVGLPARGKSYISKRLVRYISWLGYSTQTFNVGNRRRTYALKMEEGEDYFAEPRSPIKHRKTKSTGSGNLKISTSAGSLSLSTTPKKPESPAIVIGNDKSPSSSEEEKLHGVCPECRPRLFQNSNVATTTTSTTINNKNLQPDNLGGDSTFVNVRSISGTPIEGISIPVSSRNEYSRQKEHSNENKTLSTSAEEGLSTSLTRPNVRENMFKRSVSKGIRVGSTLTTPSGAPIYGERASSVASDAESVDSSVDKFQSKIKLHLHPIRPDKLYAPLMEVSYTAEKSGFDKSGNSTGQEEHGSASSGAEQGSDFLICRMCQRQYVSNSMIHIGRTSRTRNLQEDSGEVRHPHFGPYPGPIYTNMAVPVQLPASPFIAAPKDSIVHDANFFDPDNEESSRTRDQLAMSTLEELIDWLKEGGMVGIHDATNSTVKRRRMLLDRLRMEPNIRPIFIESICTDNEVINMNVEMKLQGPDYVNKDPDQSRKDFLLRMHNYEKSYETIGAHEENSDDFSYIQLVNVGKKVITQNVRGYLPSQCVFYLMQLHLKPRIIWLTRHGESLYNRENRIGGDPPLTERGRRYARALGKLMRKFYPAVDQRTVGGVIQTDLTGDPNKNYTKEEPRIKWPPRINQQQDGTTASSMASSVAGSIDGSGFDSESSTVNESENNDDRKYLAVPLTIWTSTLKRTRETGAYAFGENDNYQLKSMKALNEIYSGNFEDMTYDEVKNKYPREFVKRRRDKLLYRYPGGGGESYLDVIERLRMIIIELERLQVGVCVITHQVVLRTLLAYFLGISLMDMPRIVVPLHTLYALRIRPHGADLVTYRYDEVLDTMVEDKGF